MIRRSGADAVGLNFFGGSRRYLDIQTRQPFSEPGSAGMHRVGVFVDESIDVIQQIVRACRLTAVQLHGNESPEMVAKLARGRSSKPFVVVATSISKSFRSRKNANKSTPRWLPCMIDAADQRSFWRVRQGRRSGFGPSAFCPSECASDPGGGTRRPQGLKRQFNKRWYRGSMWQRGWSETGRTRNWWRGSVETASAALNRTRPAR